jgi:hypothetical protein
MSAAAVIAEVARNSIGFVVSMKLPRLFKNVFYYPENINYNFYIPKLKGSQKTRFLRRKTDEQNVSHICILRIKKYSRVRLRPEFCTKYFLTT